MPALIIATAALLVVAIAQLHRRRVRALPHHVDVRPASTATLNPRGWPARRAMLSTGRAADQAAMLSRRHHRDELTDQQYALERARLGQ
ncbi:hypothetical protein [Catellatospora vulcania]|uniref:hypothetical protein n=1 Tax=Catellatospora vulcania TaxID=1460450 RepID=UPI0012D4B296|nr:hypothetical protein [Catellatospora vulcania]